MQDFGLFAELWPDAPCAEDLTAEDVSAALAFLGDSQTAAVLETPLGHCDQDDALPGEAELRCWTLVAVVQFAAVVGYLSCEPVMQVISALSTHGKRTQRRSCVCRVKLAASLWGDLC